MASLTQRMRRRGILLSAGTGTAILILTMALSGGHKTHRMTVVVPTHNMMAETALTRQDLTVKSWPEPGIPGAMHSLAQALNHRLAVAVYAGAPLMTKEVGTHPTVDGLTVNEVGIDVPVALASAGAIGPGSLVDVIWTGGSSSSHSSGPTVQNGAIIAKGVRVIGVVNSNDAPAQATTSSAANASSASVPAAVELAIPRSDAGTVAIAASDGHVWLALDPWAHSRLAQDAQATSATPVTPPITSSQTDSTASSGRSTASSGSSAGSGIKVTPTTAPQSASRAGSSAQTSKSSAHP